jgi:endonuclease YncB( thermonuclease family)
MYRWFAAVVAAFLACGCANDGGHGAAAGSDGRATVVRVIDGDTIVAKVGDSEEHIRLIGIDTSKP